jgi:biotin operon repressor
MQKIIQKRNGAEKSIERIDAFLRKNREFVSLTTISQNLHLNVCSVRKYIQTLEKFGRCKIVVSDAGTTLVACAVPGELK